MSRTAVILTAVFVIAAGISLAGSLMDARPPEPSPSFTPFVQQTGNRWSIAVTATDSAFEFAIATLPPGAAAFDVLAQGASPHELQIFKLQEGTTFETFAESASRLGRNPRLFRLGTPVGGTGAGGGIQPGESRRIVLDLELGVYAFVSFINDDSESGLIQRFDVVAGEETPAGIPPAIGDIALTDDAFKLPSEPLGSGVFRVKNEGKAIHEAALFSVEGSLDELVADLSEEEAVTGEAGLGILAPERVTYSGLDLEAGRSYAFVCRLINPDTGRPYFEEGMVAEFQAP